MHLDPSFWSMLTILTGGVGTLAIFSFLIKENFIYRVFEHLFIGISAGLGIVISVKNFLWPKILVPLFGLDIVAYPDGTFSHPYSPYYLLYIPPMLFGLLYYFIYSRRYSWLARLVIGFSLGMSGGIAFKGFFNEMMPQLIGSFKPLFVFVEGSFDWHESLRNVIFVLTLLAVMYYFFFSFKSESQALKKFSAAGRLLMMVSFGAFFGSTVMARMALLVERVQFLISEWLPAIGNILSV